MLSRLGQQLGNAAGAAVGLAFFGVIFLGPFLVFSVFPVQAYRITEILGGIALIIALLFLLLAIAKPVRAISGLVLTIASYIIAAFLWVWSVIIVGSTWGIVALYVVNLFLGVGTVVSAFVAALLSGNWSVLWQLVLVAVICIVLRLVGSALASAAATVSTSAPRVD